MKVDIPSFRGQVPRLSPRALPSNAAVEATNARLQSGDLEAWRQFALTKVAAASAQTIYLLKDIWLTFAGDVDVARGIIPGDNTYRTYLTGPEVYGQPRWTNYALATSGAEPYPFATRPIGVPGPDAAPTLVVGQNATPDVSVSDAGDQFINWITSGTQIVGTTVSRVEQDNAIGHPAPSYRIDFANNSGGSAYLYRDFGVADSQTVSFISEFQPNTNGATIQAEWRMMNTEGGAGAHVVIGYPTGPSGNLVFSIGVANAWGGAPSILEQLPIAALDGSGATWYTMEIVLTRNVGGTSTVTARLFAGSGLLATVDITNAFAIGGFCGFSGYTDFVPAMSTRYDNIEVMGSGQYTAALTVATSYVYTFVNDIGEESSPSPASATILRPDGVSVTVTSPTVVPSGISSDYAIATKRIYRAATGAGGSIFRFVAEIPVAQADYIDALTDAELGEELESEGWELPPADLRGIIALPNGIMAGFRRNQLCLSAQNRPHAWPVAYRQNTDTDIVGIAAIDTTVVIITKSFPYLAFGSSPDSYSMSKMEVPQAGVSKRSIAYLIGFGVAFASPDGYMVIAGPGQVKNLTEGIFTRKQWQALNPDSIIGIAHDDTLHFWCEDSTVDPDPFNDDVVLRMHFDGNLDDTSLVNAAFVATGTPLFFSSGALIEQSLNMNTPATGGGTNAVRGAVSHAEYEIGTGDFTIEVAIRAHNASTSGRPRGILVITEVAGTRLEFALSQEDGNIFFTFRTGLVSSSSNVVMAVDPGVWHRLAIVKNAATVNYKLFVDGVNVGDTGPANYSLPTGNRSITIGQLTTNDAFDGDIDEVRITRGIARYAGNYDPGNKPFPDF